MTTEEILQKAVSELASKLTPDQIVARLAIYQEAKRNLGEIEDLFEYVKFIYPEPSIEFKKRLEKYAQKL